MQNTVPLQRGQCSTYSLQHDNALLDTTNELTLWGRVTDLCVSKITIIAPDNVLSPGRHQVVIWTNAGILSIGPLGTNLSEILMELRIFSFKNMHLKMAVNIVSVKYSLQHGQCSPNHSQYTSHTTQYRVTLGRVMTRPNCNTRLSSESISCNNSCEVQPIELSWSTWSEIDNFILWNSRRKIVTQCDAITPRSTLIKPAQSCFSILKSWREILGGVRYKPNWPESVGAYQIISLTTDTDSCRGIDIST